MEQLAKNQLHTAQITGYTSDGAGVCHIAGRAVFVKGALVGETWQVRILKVTANAVYGKAEQCLSPAAARTEPPCPVYRTCGGCSLQHMDYDEQLRMKLARVNDALTRIGGVSTPVQDIIRSVTGTKRFTPSAKRTAAWSRAFTAHPAMTSRPWSSVCSSSRSRTRRRRRSAIG